MSILSDYQHFSFDLDGTLVYTVKEYRYPMITRVVEALGGRVQSKHDLDRFWFESGRDRIIKQRFGIQPERFWPLFKELDDPVERARNTFVYDDTIATFHVLKEQGKTLSIITGNKEQNTLLIVKRLQDAPYDYFLSTSGKFPPKPHAASFRAALVELNVSPKDTVYIGNSNEDLYFAKNAGVDFIYLERGGHLMTLRAPVRTRLTSLAELLT